MGASLEHDFDLEVDVLVVGAGGGGMTAALTAHAGGLETLLVEKSEYFGGSTLLSGGSIWIPNAPETVRRGFRTASDGVVEYLETITAGTASKARLERFVEEGPKMLAFLETASPHLRFSWRPGYPDYYPDQPGGSAVGRSVEAIHFDKRRLGTERESMRPASLRTPKGMWIRSNDFHTFLSLRRSWRGKLMFLRLMARIVHARVTGAEIAARGEALIGRLRLALLDAGVPLWLESPLTRLIIDADGSVVGAEIDKKGTPSRVKTRGGVILASGGFDHNVAMRAQYQPFLDGNWSMGCPTDTGDGIRAGQDLGADVDLMDDAWWIPAIPWPDRPGVLLVERQIPGQMVVNAAGRRYTNEAAPYTDFVNAMFLGEASGVRHIPSWLIIDDTSWRTYMFAGHLPLPKLPTPVPTGWNLPEAWVDAKIVQTGQTWDELATNIDVPADALKATVVRFNEFARRGSDDDFHRGENAYDNYYGDPRYPNPNLRELDTAPFYAFKLVPGDLGTRGGLVTDDLARVLRGDGSPIRGLYATGNTSAAVMGRSYAGPGATIGPAMTFGFVAANDICRVVTEQRPHPVARKR